MHKTFAIEKFHGEATNQKSRITQAPTRVVGDFDRVGGISPLRQYARVPAGLSVIGYDWTGVSAWRVNGAPDDIVLAYNQTGARLQVNAADYNSQYSKVYWPGAGLGTLHDDYFFYVDNLGQPTYYQAPTITINLNGNTTGSLPNDSTVFAIAIYFVPSAHGLIPIRKAVARLAFSLWGYTGATLTHTPPTGLPAGAILHMYVGIHDGDKAVIEWDRIFSGTPEEWRDFNDYPINDINDFSSNASPVVFGSHINLTNGASGHYTFSVERSFCVSRSVVMEADIIIDLGGGTIVTTPVDPHQYYGHSDQYVYYSDAGYIGFSDTYSEQRAQFLRFDDNIMVVTPSVRGIYAMSKMGTWEAYGSFATANDTRIGLVPVLGGVDDDYYSAAFSGDTAFFIKEGFVHQIGAGGVEQIGRPLYRGRPSNVEAIYYDRFARRLYARFPHDANSSTLSVYDPNVKQWADIGTFTHNTAVPFPVVVLAEDDIYFAGDEVIFSDGTPLTLVEVLFEKVDMGEPNRRKQVHRVTIPYDGNYQAISVEIADSNLEVFNQCVVNDRGGYFDVRCPTTVARAFDLRITVATDDENFAINPPLIFEYRPYGREYGRV